MKILKLIFSAEMLFVLFLTSGTFKESLGIGIDVTAIFLVLSAAAALWRLLQKPTVYKREITPIALFVLLLSVLLISLTYTPSKIYASEKMISLVLVTAPSFIIPILLLRKEGALSRLLLSFIVVGFTLATITVFQNLILSSGFVGFNDGNYLGLGRVLGVAFLIAVTYLYPMVSKGKKTWVIGIILILSSALLIIGARMPLIAAGLVFGYYVLTSVKIKKGVLYVRKGFKATMSLVLAGAASIYFLYKNGFLDTLIFRLQTLFSADSGGASATARIMRYDTAWDMWKDNPLWGSGIGSFGLTYNGIDGREYPHNIFLELLSEGGAIALIVFLALLTLVLKRFIEATKMKVETAIPLICVVVYSLINANVSGNLNDQRILFSFLAVMCMLPVFQRANGLWMRSNASK